MVNAIRLPAASRREPRLVPTPDLFAADPSRAGGAADLRDTPDGPETERRNRLFPALPVPKVPGRTVRGTATPLIRKELYAESTLGPVITASLLAHALLLGALIYKASTHAKAGTPSTSQNAPVEMVFSQPEASSGMVGQPSPDMGGGNQAKQPSQASNSPPAPAEAQQGPTQSTETPPMAPPLPKSDDGISKPEQTEQRINPARPVTGHRTTPEHPARPVPHPRPTPAPSHHTPSPFDNPMDLSFDEAPAPRRQRRGRPGGSRGALDLSIGPMVENGALNAHYSSRTTVHGVSSDYAADIDAWIQRHLYYPPEAAQQGQQGASSVHVILDRDGHVFKVFETNSSGSVELDASTMGMFQGAQLPPVPPDMKDEFINFDVTINYILISN
ncbi:MAG: TonB family protein [Acetobacter sp.]|uniref:energy transducer TonB n=2 Tax=Acetobacter sp. TaxID=440 RepID=UPI0039E9A618